MQWNARSQAAYQGYSHLSGIEMMSALLRCRQSALRPCWRAGRRRRLQRVAVQPLRDVEVIELLGPDHAGERLALHEARVRIGDVLLQRGVELVGLGPAPREDRVEIVEAAGRVVRRQPQRARGPSRRRGSVSW